MIDLGLTTGIKDLWQENLLRDYSLVVEGQEFQVHKVVLAAVSKYFKAMLAEGFLEREKDRVEVKGFSADIVSKLLEFLYSADENVIGGDALGILQCAMYLQMPLVADFCVKELMNDKEREPNTTMLSSHHVVSQFITRMTLCASVMCAHAHVLLGIFNARHGSSNGEGTRNKKRNRQKDI